MPSHKPPQVRRAIRFALRALLDRELTPAERERVREYFGYSCAFCGTSLRDAARSHIDHLISVAVGGPNHISNRVLACSQCNGDEKLERDWREFLLVKSGNEELLAAREAKILGWVNLNRPTFVAISPAHAEHLEQETQRAVAAFDAAVEKLRAVKKEAG